MEKVATHVASLSDWSPYRMLAESIMSRDCPNTHIARKNYTSLLPTMDRYIAIKKWEEEWWFLFQ